MKIKAFIFASLIYTAIIGGAVFFIDTREYTLNLENANITLPLALWFVLPLLVYFILALFHLGFYSFLNHFKFRNFFKDSQNYEDFIKDLLLEKNPKISFRTKEFKQVAELLKNLKNKEKTSNSKAINEILELKAKIEKGECVNLSKLKLEQNNALYIQNEKNRCKSDLNYAYNKIKNLTQTKNELEQNALEILLEKGTYEQIKNIKIPRTKEQVLTLIERFANKDLELSAVEFEVLLQSAEFSEKEYVKIAKMSKKLLNPDAILSIFLKIKNQNSEALRAYLYLLAEFAMFDELLEHIKNDEKFSDFKAVLALREKNIKIDLEKIID